MNPFAHLLGRHVRAVWVESETQRAMRFDVDYYGEESVYIDTEGDCCSETWFADVIGVQNLINEEIRGIELLTLPEPEDDRTRKESDEAYGVRLTTAKGYCEIVYRNSSNGYYGGSAEEMRSEDGERLTWTRLTKDWSA